jgi:hypothetical protein
VSELDRLAFNILAGGVLGGLVGTAVAVCVLVPVMASQNVRVVIRKLAKRPR